MFYHKSVSSSAQQMILDILSAQKPFVLAQTQIHNWMTWITSKSRTKQISCSIVYPMIDLFRPYILLHHGDWNTGCQFYISMQIWEFRKKIFIHIYMWVSENVPCLFLSGNHSLDSEQWYLFDKCQLHPWLHIKYSVTRDSEYLLTAVVLYLYIGVGSEQCSSMSSNIIIVQKHQHWMKGCCCIPQIPSVDFSYEGALSI